MDEVLRLLLFALAAIFIGGLLYSQYALFRVEIDRRKTLGWGWLGFRSPWNTKDLTQHGLAYQRRGLRALGVSLAAFALAAVVMAIASQSAA